MHIHLTTKAETNGNRTTDRWGQHPRKVERFTFKPRRWKEFYLIFVPY